jgi:hypothetical protein
MNTNPFTGIILGTLKIKNIGPLGFKKPIRSEKLFFIFIKANDYI